MTAQTHIPQGAAANDQQLPKRALILPGGGLRLSYAAGAMAEIFAHGLTFQHMDGTSGGSLNLAMLLSGLSTDEICKRWRSFKMRDTLALLPLKNYIGLNRFVAAGSAKGFRQKVYPHLGIDFDKIRAATGVQATFNVCNFGKKMNEVIVHQNLTEDFLLAGMSLPGTLPPVTIDGEVYLDSGFIQDANLMEAVKRGASELWLIWIMGNTKQYRENPLNLYVQMLEMSANGALIKEIQQIKDINARIANGETVYGHNKPIILHLIKPEHPLPLDSALYTGEISHATLIEMGRSDAKAYFYRMKSEGVPLEPQILEMTTLQAGFQFKETMQGGFSLNATDPIEGNKHGKQANTKLAMHAAININSLAEFIKNPEHLGQLTGTIDFAPLGLGMVANTGVFNLFKPTDDPALTLMVYELGFEHQGQAYYLAGKKEVRQASIFKLWSATTTLYTQLHKGTDKSGTVIGAGILSLGICALLKLVTTITVTNTFSFTEKLKTICCFCGFFIAQLWKTYVTHSK